MRTVLLSCALVLVTLPACKSTAPEGADPQAVVESVAKQNPGCTRLSVHCKSANATAPSVCASTALERRGKPSGPEDAKAMQTGEVVVLDEQGALDVTVPILIKDGKCSSVCGVTLKTDGASREQLIARAKTIAKAVESGLGGCCRDASSTK